MHLVSRASTSTVISILAGAEVLRKLPEIVRGVSFKLQRGKKIINFTKTSGLTREAIIRFRTQLKGLGDKLDDFLVDFENASKETLRKIVEFDLVDSWKKLDDLGFSQAARRNIVNLKQRSIIDQYADNIANASNARKGNFGELGADLDLNGKGYESLMSRIDNIDVPGHNGLDGVYRKDGQFFIVEGKYTDSASLNAADDGTGLARQMSDDWIATRDWSGVNLDESTIRGLLRNKNYQRVLAKVAPDGTVTYRLVDADGYVIRGLVGNFIP